MVQITILPRANAEVPRSCFWPNFVYKDLDDAFGDAFQRLQDHALFLDLDDQIEFRASLTHLLLWTAYESELFHALRAKCISGHIPSAVLVVIRKVLLDPSRLSKMQQRMIDANCLRRGQLVKSMNLANKLVQISALEKPSRDNHPGGIKTTSLEEDRILWELEVTRRAWTTNIMKNDFTSTYLEPSRLSIKAASDENYPKPPRIGGNGVQNVCPFCSDHLDVSTVSSRKAWR